MKILSKKSWLTSLSGVGIVVIIVMLMVSSWGTQQVQAGKPPTPTPGGGSGNTYVRVNQVGYITTATKPAYVLSKVAGTGATFQVKNSGGSVVYSGTLGANLGAWSNTFPYVYGIDFSSVTAVSTYSIVVSGAVAATSPNFKIDTAANLYSFLLANEVFFYKAQRDGSDVDSSVLNRQPAHLNDQSATVYYPPTIGGPGWGKLMGDITPVPGVPPVDVMGGWFDAGDFLKYVQTASYVDTVMALAVRDFPSIVGAGSGADMTLEAKRGVDWLMKMWNDNSSTMYYQVGIGDGNSKHRGDHDIWRLPQVDDTYAGTDPVYQYIRHFPVFQAGDAGSPISPNLAGRQVAAMALCYQSYRTSDPTFANKCLLYAEHIFDLAGTNWSGQLVTASPYSYYNEVAWRDDLEMGSTEMYFALASAGGNPPPGLPHTDPLYYLQQAAHWANAYITGTEDTVDTLNLYDISGIAHYELYRAITQAGNPTGLEVTQTALLNDMKKMLDKGIAQAATDPFKLGFPYPGQDTTPHAMGMAIIASEYDELTGTTTYVDFGRNQLNWVLGANAWGSTWIIGAGSTFPKCPQHQVANLVGNLDGTPPILLGGVPDGPNALLSHGIVGNYRPCPPGGGDYFTQFDGSGAQYHDDVAWYGNTEPCDDYAVHILLAFTRQIAGRP
jgi:endoglucanase